MSMPSVLAALDADRDQSVTGLCDFLRIPSVSTQPQHKADMHKCAAWLAGRFVAAGLHVEILPTAGHPVVLARNAHVAGRPTVLMYGHYDVQPPEPLELWTTPPFTPTVRDGAIYARGAADDKGQVWAHLQAVAAWQSQGGLPVNVTLLIEGEEEIGSEHLEAFVKQHREQLRADIAVVSDTNQFARGIPAVTYGLRGLVYEEVFLTGPSHDLHSGIYGGAVPNPANVLTELLASLHDRDGRVAIEGFYDDVVPLTDAERAQWARLGFNEAAFAAELGLASLNGEAGFTTLERRWARPTCDINGLTSGYQGQGAKTIIPSKASAKISMRLVPRQDPLRIQAAFEKALRERCPANVQMTFAHHTAAHPFLVPMESPAMKLAADAVERGFGKKCIFMREGGTIPVVAMLKNVLGVDTLLVGFGLGDDRIHSPNEKFDLDALHNGTRTLAILYDNLARL